MRQARALAMAGAVAALAMLLSSGPGTRFGVWPWETGLSLLEWATYTGLCSAAVGFVLVLLAVLPRWRKGTWVALLAMVLGVAAAAPPILLLKEAKAYPYIHDITTDPFDPPAFVALAEQRARAPNGAAYGGMKVAEQQNRAYPDIKPLLVKSSPQETVQKAIDAARALGWDIVSSDSASGRIEATATTLWFGFKDDVVVRIRAQEGGSRVDVRSASRVGDGDIGANAKRVRKFLARLA